MRLSRFHLSGIDQNNLPPVQNVNGCPVLDLASNACLLANGNIIGCNAIRECDPLTSATHFEYGTLAPSGNVDITQAAPGTPISNATFAPLGSNAPGCASNPSLCPGYVAPSSQPTAAQIAQATTQPVAQASNTAPAAAASANMLPASVITPGLPPANSSNVQTSSNWLTQSMFGGIPNWGLVAGAAAIFFFMGGKR